MYRVKPGDTVAKIAERYNWSTDSLTAINNIPNPNVLEVDQLLRVPSGRENIREHSSWTEEEEEAPIPLVERFVSAHKGSLVWPIRHGEGRVTSVFGRRSGNFHEGIDIAASKGVSVYSTQSGKVIYSGSGLSGYGKLLVIKHDGYLSVYAHNRSLNVERGDFVKQGDKVAEVGDSGRARGSHLHFEIRIENEQGRYAAINPTLIFG